MTNNQDSHSPMLRFTIAVLVFVVIAATAGRQFSQVFDNVELTEAEGAIGNFTSSIIKVHKNWILQGRPNKVVIRGVDSQGKPTRDWIFVMNSQGWPINVIDGDEKPNCDALWHGLQKNSRLEISAQENLMAVNEYGLLETAGFNDRSGIGSRKTTWVCQYIVARQLLFRYRLDTGKVELD